MQKSKFVLLHKGNETTVSNTETDSENAFCNNKIELLEIVIGLLGQKKMTEENASSLIKEIMSDTLKLPFFPIKIAKYLTSLFEHSLVAKIAQEEMPFIKENIADIKSDTISFKLCLSCKMHGRFMGKGILSSKFSLKEEAIEILDAMYKQELVTLSEKERLATEIMESQIPQSPNLN